MTEITLFGQDEQRLNAVLDRLHPEQMISLEGEPLYADREWGTLHQFAYNVILLEIANRFPSYMDLLFDEYTTTESNFDLNFFLAQITLGLSTNVVNESELVNGAEKIIELLREQGRITCRGGLLILETNNSSREVNLTTRGGKIACATLDAAYQQSKSQNADTAVLVHSTDFIKQQKEMLAVLQAFNDGGMPFQTFLNIFTRIRKGNTRLANIWITNAEGKLENIG